MGLVLAVWPAVSTAQEYSDTTSVLVVEVPVNVTRDGEPVLGLTAENFEIRDEGKDQVISGFDVINLAEIDAPEEMMTMGASARRHFVFVFDLSFSTPNAVVKSREAALDVVRTGLHPTDLVAVATYSSRSGPRMILNFTSDRRQIEAAFTTLGLIQQRGKIDDPLGFTVRSPEIGAERNVSAEQGGGNERVGFDPEVEIQEVLERIAVQSRQADLRRQVGIFTSTFGFLAELLEPLDGRKHVVFLSEGFDASVLFGTADAERLGEIQQAIEFGEIWKVDNDERFGDTRALGEIEEMLDRFTRADAAIHSIDIGRLVAGGTSVSQRGRQDGLFLLSSSTGGDFYRNYNDLSEAMTGMLKRTSVTYVLAFQPSNLRQGDVDFRRLRVRLKDVPRGTDISYRKGYFPPASFTRLTEAQQQLRTAQQMVTGGAADGPEFDVLMMPFAGRGSEAYVPVLIQVSGAGLVSGEESGQLPIEFYAYASSAEGEVKDFFGEKLTFDLETVGPALKSTGIRFYGHLDLEPGDYAVRMMVRNARTGASSVEVVPLTVPDFSQEHLAVMPPLFPQGVERWVQVRENEERAGRRQMDYPFMFKERPFVPAIRPVFQSGQVVAVSLVASKSTNGHLEVDSLILAADGSTIPGTHLRVLEREKLAETGLERMIAAFEVPNLPGGDYSLVLTMSDPSVGNIESGTLDFSIGQRATTAGLFDAPEWMPDLAEIVGRLGPADPTAKLVKIDREAVRSGYLDVLRLLSQGRSMSAVLALIEVESGSVNPASPMGTLAQIRKVQKRVLDDLTSRDPELLLAAILLHREAYSQYRLRKESYLAVHARNTTLTLIDEYADRARAGNPNQLASRILTSMAPEVYSSGAHISAMMMFDRAIDLDRNNGLALTGLGFMLETTGREERTPTYQDAVELFERAVALDPHLHEARLRLAVNQRRLERFLEAGQSLNLLIEGENVPDWITSLAFQELATLYSGLGHYDKARKVLERGGERLPEESKLALQLAYVNERLQRQFQASKAIDRARGGGTAARYLYLQVPRMRDAEEAEKWKERAQNQMSSLAAALGRAGVGP